MTRRAPAVTPLPREILENPVPCRDPKIPPDTMHPAERADPEAMARALRVCRHCPIQIKAKCLDWALENFPQVEGVWGGTSHKHRKAIKQGKKPRAANLAELALAA